MIWDRAPGARSDCGTDWSRSECVMEAGGQADGKRGHHRGGPHLQTRAWTKFAVVGTLGRRALAKGTDTEAGKWVPGLPMLLWDREGPDRETGRGPRITTPFRTKPRCGDRGGRIPYWVSAPRSNCPPPLGHQVLNVRGGSGDSPDFFPREPCPHAARSALC